MTEKPTRSDRIYDFLVGNGHGERISTGITEAAAKVVPANFLRLLVATLCTKVGDALSKPGVMITWMLSTLGAPSALIGLIVPIRESGALVLQIFVGELASRYRLRKWFWVAGSVVQGSAILGMVPVALFLSGAAAGWAVVGLIAIFSLARGVCSVISKDLVGRTIPKTRRGRLGGIAASASGVIAIAVGIWLLLYKDRELEPVVFAVILGVAGGLWFLAAMAMSTLDEKPAKTEAKKNPFLEIKSSIGLLKTDSDFRLFCIARALLAGTVLSMPFYVILARHATDGSSGSLGILLIAGSVATALSGAVWGRLADHSSRLVLATAGILAGVIGFATAALGGIEFSGMGGSIFWGALFFLIGLAHTGIRQGRKTHLVDMSDADNRASMVAVSNTLIGIVVLAGSSVGLLTEWIGERWVIFIFALPGLFGGLLALKLPEVQREGKA
ncbi:MAG: MFS transporter [Verrucomicrobiales bacterium]|nr:MFS transporter [Verrucomicrobiales bacterium]